jgi:hypothetical protein
MIVLPDTERLLCHYLANVPELVKLVDPERIGTRSPRDTSRPWLRVTRIGGAATHWMRLDRGHIQIDSFVPPRGPDGGDYRAMQLARVARAALFAAPNWSDGSALICAVEEIGFFSDPDLTRTPPTPRVIWDGYVSVRPA